MNASDVKHSHTHVGKKSCKNVVKNNLHTQQTLPSVSSRFLVEIQ